MQLLLLISAGALLSFPSTIHGTCPTSSGPMVTPRRPEARTEVDLPGLRFRPSTGKLLTVFQLNNATLVGHFVSHSGLGLYFKSTCEGQVHVWRAGGTNIMEHERISQQREIYFVKIEGHQFAYDAGRAGRLYKLPDHHRTRKEAEHEFNRRSGQDNSTDESELRQAFEDLAIDPDSRLLASLSQALGEFGIYGHTSPCALPLYAMAMSVSRQLPSNKDEEDCTKQRRVQRSWRKRVRRAWWWGSDPDPTEASCSLEDDPNNDNCIGMCGKGCWCWDWDMVCGDCCHHQGCYEHDLCCGRGFFTTACLLPFSHFSCDSYSKYPACLD